MRTTRPELGGLGLPVHMADDPLTAVARGTGILLDKLDVFSRVLATDEED